jgi:DNA-directed RNA polymerase specialized sigma24 family protein
VLGRLVQDDPLGIRGKVAARLQSDALLFDADRVYLRVLARVSRFAGRYRGRPELAAWIESAVAESVEELLREEHESLRSRRPEASEKVGVFAALALPLGLDPMAMRVACAAFNHLPCADRSAFTELVLRGSSLDTVARSAGESATEVARRARRALDAILAAALQDHDKESTGRST